MNIIMMLAAVTAITSTDNDFWRAGEAEVADAPKGEVVCEANEEGPVVVYENTDGSKVLVAGNFHDKEPREISVKIDGKYLNLRLPPKSFNTVVVFN